MNGKSLRQRYGIEEQNEEIAEDEGQYDPNPDRYVAYSRSKGQRKEEAIMVRYANGIREVVFYNYLVNAISVDSNHVAIMSTEGVYLVQGRNLHGLLEGIQDRKIRSISGYAFDHDGLVEADIAIIETIEYLTNEDYYALFNRRNEARPPSELAKATS